MKPCDFKFRLRGIVWTVKVVSKPDECLDLDGALGITIFDRCEILLRSTLTIERLRSVFFHELTHVCFEVIDTGPIDEELACNLIGDGMPEFLAQWHRLPEWLRGTIKHDSFERCKPEKTSPVRSKVTKLSPVRSE